ncbi:MAG: heavy-metal-associated domain-containing protein [Patescibacteria group bacterium]|nr:heavy-metal-associated domain-containing protein [Patescibacteria group bacterium]MCL5095711.1 heavy-metal-associated domain-containing protein [Patescibacteria group bacterium]
MKTIKLQIEGMHCDACGKVISMDLEALDGVKRVQIDQKAKLAEISFDEEKTSEEEILQTIKNSGYTPKSII